MLQRLPPPTDNHVRTCSRMPLDGQQAAEASLKPVKGWEIRRATNAGAGDHGGGHERIEWHHESGMTCKHACMESEIQPLYFGGSGMHRPGSGDLSPLHWREPRTPDASRLPGSTEIFTLTFCSYKRVLLFWACMNPYFSPFFCQFDFSKILYTQIMF